MNAFASDVGEFSLAKCWYQVNIKNIAIVFLGCILQSRQYNRHPIVRDVVSVTSRGLRSVKAAVNFVEMLEFFEEAEFRLDSYVGFRYIGLRP